MDELFHKLGERDLFNPIGRLFVIGDIHGESAKLKRILENIKKELCPEDHVVFCGDFIDVGPNTPETLIQLQKFKFFHKNTYFIYGNHEEMMLRAIRGNPNMWFSNGGRRTLSQFSSYGVDNIEDLKNWIEDEKITIFDNLIPYYETKEILITHAPISSNLENIYPIKEGVIEKLRDSIRWNFVDYENRAVRGVSNKLFICGHQNGFGKVKAARFYQKENRIFLDSGAGYYYDAPISCIVVSKFFNIKVITS